MSDLDDTKVAWISGGYFDDFDAQAAHLHGYDQQYEQLSRGPFEGSYQTYDLGVDLRIHFEMANRALAQVASTPRGRYAACFLSANSPDCTLNAGHFSPDHVAICPERQFLQGQTSAGMSICCMDIAVELLPDEVLGIRSAQVLLDPISARRLRDFIESGMVAFAALKSPASYPVALTAFKSSLGDLLWQTEVQASSKEFSQSSRHISTRTLQAFRRACDYIQHNLTDGVSIVALCREVGMSRRSLECVFQSVVSMGPGNYIRTLQLNQIRRDLLSNATSDESIGTVAARRGIWHWSRFSHHYARLFGELPSQTRRRAGNDRASF